MASYKSPTIHQRIEWEKYLSLAQEKRNLYLANVLPLQYHQEITKRGKQLLEYRSLNGFYIMSKTTGLLYSKILVSKSCNDTFYETDIAIGENINI